MKIKTREFRKVDPDSPTFQSIHEISEIPKIYGEYHKAVLHVHTPASHDYKLLPELKDEDGNDIHRPFTAYATQEVVRIAKDRGLFSLGGIDLEYVSRKAKKIDLFATVSELLVYMLMAKKLIDQNIEIVCVTDHNTTYGFERLKCAVSIISKSYPADKTIPVVQLGIELSCGDGVHVVGIISESGRLPLESFMQEFVLSAHAGTYLPSWEVIEQLNKMGNIGYVAHIKSSPIFHKDSGSHAYRLHLISQNTMSVFGVHEADQRFYYLNKLKEVYGLKDVAVFLDEDSHEIDSLCSHPLWIKGQQLDFNMFKNAIEDSDVAIRFKNPKLPRIFIMNVLVDGHGFLGHDEQKLCSAFSTALSCIIGGRGSGKSTLLDCLSVVLSQQIRSIEELKNVSSQGKISIALKLEGVIYYVMYDPVIDGFHEGEFVRSYLYGVENAYQYAAQEETHFDWQAIAAKTREKISIYTIQDNKILEVTQKLKFFKQVFHSAYSVNDMVKSASDSSVTTFIAQQLNNSRNTIPTLMPRNVHDDEQLRKQYDNIHRTVESHRKVVEEKLIPFNSTAKNLIIDYRQTLITDLKVDWEMIVDPDEFKGKAGWFNKYNIDRDGLISFLQEAFESTDVFGAYLKFVGHDWTNFTSLLIKMTQPLDFSAVENQIIKITPENSDKVLTLINDRIVRRARFQIYKLLDRYYSNLDQFDLLLDINSSEDAPSDPIFKPISQVSLGQKVVALLDFVFWFGKLDGDDTPLLLDQPEDNLDSSYIFGHLVQALRAQKDSRQVIIVTHNSTILTNSKPEQVIAMKSDNLHGWVDQTGYPTETDVVYKILNLLEGGVDSFKHREFIYRPILSKDKE